MQIKRREGSTYTNGVVTFANGEKKDVLCESRPNENGGTDVIIHAPALNISAKQETGG